MDSGEFVQIERISRRERGRPGEELEVLLSDASSFFASVKVWQEKPFHEGEPLAPEELERIQQRSEFVRVHARALHLLSRSEHSRFLLRQKLLSRHFEIETIEAVLDSLETNGLLSDDRFAQSWIRSRIRRHPEGRSALVAGLRARGVSAEVADRAVAAVTNEEEYSEEDAARTLAKKLSLKTVNPHTLSQRLARRGFAPQTIRAVIQEYSASDSPDDESDFTTME